jgi:hypothetical protein
LIFGGLRMWIAKAASFFVYRIRSIQLDFFSRHGIKKGLFSSARYRHRLSSACFGLIFLTGRKMKADSSILDSVFSQEKLDELFPPDRADRFFEALLGDASDGAYDISLSFGGQQKQQLIFYLELTQRPGKCLVCSLTYGLPKVFSRHPVINIEHLVTQLGGLMNGQGRVGAWHLGATREINKQKHVVPLILDMTP